MKNTLKVSELTCLGLALLLLLMVLLETALLLGLAGLAHWVFPQMDYWTEFGILLLASLLASLVAAVVGDGKS